MRFLVTAFSSGSTRQTMVSVAPCRLYNRSMLILPFRHVQAAEGGSGTGKALQLVQTHPSDVSVGSLCGSQQAEASALAVC